MSNLPAPQNNLALDPSLLSNIKSYDEYLDFYIQLDQRTTAYSWLKADLLLYMSENLGENSLVELARDTKQPRSTIINYIRTARAFPPDQRDPGATFSLHFQASYADSYDNKEQKFEGKKRFEALNEAIDNNMSTRQLAEKVQADKMSKDNLNYTPEQDLQTLQREIHSLINFFLTEAPQDDKAYEIVEATTKWLKKEKKKYQNRA